MVWRNIMDPQKPRNSPRPRPGVAEKQRVAKERVAQKFRSWTMQNKMRGVVAFQMEICFYFNFNLPLKLKRLAVSIA